MMTQCHRMTYKILNEKKKSTLLTKSGLFALLPTNDICYDELQISGSSTGS